MRLKSEIWVKAYLRRCAVHGSSGAVLRHGDDDAGAIYIKVLRGDGLCALFGPAPAGLAGADFDRRWVAMLDGAFVPEKDVDARIEREARIDSDLWLVEIADQDGKDFLGEDLLANKS